MTDNRSMATVPRTQSARLVETHTSTVIFLGDRAYKVKKAVDLGFLDFRSRVARVGACQDEVTLNRRLAPDVYLGVATVFDPDGDPCEPMVVMSRMPDDRRLTKLVLDGASLDEELRGIAGVLTDFHRRCETSAAITAAGSRDSLAGLWREGIEQLHRFRGVVLEADDVDEMAERSARYLLGRGALFAERQDAGLVRDGHGDLLADDIFCLDDGPRILDCIEFDQRLRVGDVLLDVAFLAMDLERLGAPELARTFLSAYCQAGGEQHPQSLEHFFIAYRAFVRTKVACLRWEQGVAESAPAARKLATLTLKHLRSTALPVVLVGGLPGVGKTTLSNAIAGATDHGWITLRSDVVRKEHAGLDPSVPTASPFRTGLYRPEQTNATYRELLSRARDSLDHGRPVIMDASWSDSTWRAAAAEVAADTSADLVQLCCVAPATVAERRLHLRRDDASDADASIAHAMAAHFDPWPDGHAIDTTLALDDSLDRALRRIELPARPRG